MTPLDLFDERISGSWEPEGVSLLVVAPPGLAVTEALARAVAPMLARAQGFESLGILHVERHPLGWEVVVAIDPAMGAGERTLR